MLRQIRKEDLSTSESESESGLKVDMTLLTPRATHKKVRDSIPDDMLDNVYLPLLSDVRPPRTSSKIKISSPAQIQKSGTPKAITKPATPAQIQKPATPVQIQKPATPVQIQKPTHPPIQKQSSVQDLPKFESTGRKNISKLAPPVKSDHIPKLYKNTNMYKPDKPIIPEPAPAPEPIYETISFNDIPTETDLKPKTKSKTKRADLPTFDDKLESKTRGARPELDDQYIKQHTTDLEYIEIQDHNDVHIGEGIKYINKDEKLVSGFVKDKYLDKETNAYRYKINGTQQGGFAWNATSSSMKRAWHKPILTDSTERMLDLIIKYLNHKYDGEFTDFCQDPDKFIKIAQRLKKK
jgi:hypothetical protein